MRFFWKRHSLKIFLFSTLISLGLLVFGCGDIVVKVSKNGKSTPDLEPESAHHEPKPTLSDFQAWKEDAEEFKKNRGRVLIKKIRQGLRPVLRQTLSAIQDFIDDQGQDRHVPMEPIKVGQHLDDIKDPLMVVNHELLPWLGVITEHQELIALQDLSSHEKKIYEIEEGLIALFYDFGINIRGHSQVEELPSGEKTYSSEVFWQVIPEKRDVSQMVETIAPDSLKSLRMRIQRTVSGSTSFALKIEILVGVGLYENELKNQNLYDFLSLEARHQTSNIDEPIVDAYLQFGQRDFAGDQKNLFWSKSLKAYPKDSKILEELKIHTEAQHYIKKIDQKLSYEWSQITKRLMRTK